MKKYAKKIIVYILGKYVKKLLSQNDIKIVAVIGSIGKTSTKYAIANVLGEQYRVRFQEGNYNDIVSVPLIFFGLEMPSLMNPIAWVKTFGVIRKKLSRPYPYDVVVVELGTDGPGQIEAFSSYLHSDITVVSAITPEHMEFFSDLDDVAKEELSTVKYSNQMVVNSDLVDKKYVSACGSSLITYGVHGNPDYRLTDINYKKETASFKVTNNSKTFISATMEAVSIAELYSATASTVVGKLMGVSADKIQSGIAKLKPISGRMQRLHGIKNSLIIDETYNASPVAMKVALDSLYALEAPQKVAILGNMNELGSLSKVAHQEIGEYCDVKQLDLVVTIGTDANRFLAPAAKKKGCNVSTFIDPYSAGKYIKNFIETGAIILAKGSQNGVFAEEALKILLANSDDTLKLVRQSPKWLKIKEKQFRVSL